MEKTPPFFSAEIEAILDCLSFGVLMVNIEMRLVFANRSVYERLGFQPKEIIGQPCHLVCQGLKSPDFPTDSTCPVLSIRELGDPISVIQNHVSKGGQNNIVYVSGLGFPEDEPTHFVCLSVPVDGSPGEDIARRAERIRAVRGVLRSTRLMDRISDLNRVLNRINDSIDYLSAHVLKPGPIETPASELYRRIEAIKQEVKDIGRDVGLAEKS